MSIIQMGVTYRSEVTGLFYRLREDMEVEYHTGSTLDAWSPADFKLPMLERLLIEERIHEVVGNYNLNGSKL